MSRGSSTSGAEPEIPLLFKLIPVALAFLVVMGGVAAAYTEVPTGHVSVEKEWESVNGEVHGPGQVWTVPVRDELQLVEIRPRTYTMSDKVGEGNHKEADGVAVQTVDGTTVRVDITTRYRVEADKADVFVTEWNTITQAEMRLIRPTVRSALRDEASGIKTSEIYTAKGRAKLAIAAEEALNEELEGEALILEAVQIRNVDLPKQYDQALTDKEVAQQRIETERNRLEQARVKAERKEVDAEAEAEVIRITGEALNKNPEVLQLRYIEALKEGNTIYVPSDGEMVLTKDVGNSTQES